MVSVIMKTPRTTWANPGIIGIIVVVVFAVVVHAVVVHTYVY